MRHRTCLSTASAFTAALCLFATDAFAADVTVANDSTVIGVPSTVFNTFLAGESAAAWLTASCTGDIIAAQIYTASSFGGSPSALEQAVTLFNGSGSFPTPGAVMVNQSGGNAVIAFPTVQDKVMNDYRHLDPGPNTVPLRVAVTAGQVFVVSLKFLNQNDNDPFAISPVADTDGCQAQKNAADALPGGWSDACLAGVMGDWVIRAVIECQPEVPAGSDWSRLALVATLVSLGGLTTAGVWMARGARLT